MSAYSFDCLENIYFTMLDHLFDTSIRSTIDTSPTPSISDTMKRLTTMLLLRIARDKQVYEYEKENLKRSANEILTEASL